MKRFFMAAVVVMAVAAASSARAGGLSLFSGRTLGAGSAVNISAGVPDLSVLYLTDWGSNTDFGGFLRFGYITPVAPYRNTLWLSLGGEYKRCLRNYGRYNLGLIIDAGPFMFFKNKTGNEKENRFNPGILFDPALVFGIPLKEIGMLNMGAGIPLILTFRDEVTAQIPIGFILGGEIFIDPELTINANFEVGPGIIAGGNDPGTDLYALFKVGFSFGL